MNNLRDDMADRMIRANGEAEAARLREMEGEIADYRQSLDGIKKSVESLGDVKEFAHKEHVRVYRNVQASLQEELEKRNSELTSEMSLQNEAITKLVSDQRDEMTSTMSRLVAGQKEDIEVAMTQLVESQKEDLEQTMTRLVSDQREGMRSDMEALLNKNGELNEALEKRDSELRAEMERQISSLKEEMETASARQSEELKTELEALKAGNAEELQKQTAQITNDLGTSFTQLIPSDLGKIKSSPIQVVTFLFTVLNTAAIIVLILMRYLIH